MSAEPPAAFTNEALDLAVECYEPDPSKVSAEIYAARLAACDKCPMYRNSKCVAGGLCCEAIVTLAARRPDAWSHWYLCPWLKLS